MNKKSVLIVASIALLSVLLSGALLYANGKSDRSAQPPQGHLTNLVRMHSPTLGRSDAKVQIVEFLDPACGTCRDFYPLVKQMMAANPDQIHLVLRYAPFHDGSEAVVSVLEAARRQDKFWPALEALLVAQDDWAPHHRPQIDLVWKHLDGLGLDLELLRAEMTSPAISGAIALDKDDAKALGVTMTPEFFVNGKPLPSFGSEQLRALVSDALRSARR